MKAVLISRQAKELQALNALVQAQGPDVLHTHLRNEQALDMKAFVTKGADFLIVDCSGPLQSQDIHTLADWMAHQVDLVVMVMSQSLESDLLLLAMHAGIREVMLTPMVPQEVESALQRLSQRKKGGIHGHPARSKVITFMSCKGGSGATFLATNFADILAKEMAQKTIFMDLDLHYGDAAYYVSQGPKQSDITELTRQIDRLDAQLLASSVLHVAPRFDLLSAPEVPEASYAINPEQLDGLMQVAQANYDVVVLDVERVLGPLTLRALEVSDVVFLVMENLLPFVRDAKRLVAKFRELGFKDSKIRIVVNRYEKNETIDIAQIEKALGIKVSYTIRSSFEDVAQAINTGVPLTRINTNSPIVRALRSMAQRFSDQAQAPASGWLSRMFKAPS